MSPMNPWKSFTAVLLPALATLGCMADQPERVGTVEQQVVAPIGAAHCSIQVQGKGVKAMETDYLPHVIQCENGGANLQALKAQAIAARSVAYYNIATSGSICDGQGCQVYSCGAVPKAIHHQAVQETAGQYLSYGSMLTYGFYVAGDAGAKPPGCIDVGGYTSKYVTNNKGKTGGNVEQTSLGYIGAPGYGQNRGCISQWGARCLENKVGYKHLDILRFYYGADIDVLTAPGPCTTNDSGCTAAQVTACGNFGCGCVEGQCNGAFCPGTGCSAKQTKNCAAFGCNCVDGGCSGAFCPGTGCTAKETLDCGKFGCGCVDHACSGGFCAQTGCTAKQTLDCGKFGCNCTDGKCDGGFCDGAGCTAKELIECDAKGCSCVDHQCDGGACQGMGCTAKQMLVCDEAGMTCELGDCVSAEEPPVDGGGGGPNGPSAGGNGGSDNGSPPDDSFGGFGGDEAPSGGAGGVPEGVPGQTDEDLTMYGHCSLTAHSRGGHFDFTMLVALLCAVYLPRYVRRNWPPTVPTSVPSLLPLA